MSTKTIILVIAMCVVSILASPISQPRMPSSATFLSPLQVPSSNLLRQTNADDCDVTLFKKCGADFKLSIGAPHAQDEDGIVKAVAAYEKAHGGAPGFNNVCGFHIAFGICMGGPRSVSACVNTTFLIDDARWSPNEAYEMVERHAGYDYKCMPETMKVIDTNYDCMVMVKATQTAAMAQCAAAWNQDVNGHFNNHTIVCDAMTKYSLCDKQVYQTVCPGVGLVICNLVRIEVEAIFPYCKDRGMCVE